MHITTTSGPVTILTVTGDIDSSNYYQLVEAAERALGANSRQLVIDLSGVGFMSSAGLIALQNIAVRAAQHAGKAVLCGPGANLLPMLRTTGFTEFMGCYPDVATAMASFA